MESQNCPNFKSCVGNEPPRSIFLPKKQPKSQNRRILKSACQSVTFALWACREKFNINFLSQNFFLASPHVYWLRKKFWAKMSMLNFSRWLIIEGNLWNDSNKKSWKWHVSLILALGGAPRADLHRKPPSTMGHESLIQRRPSLSHPGWLKYFFRHTISYSKLPYT